MAIGQLKGLFQPAYKVANTLTLLLDKMLEILGYHRLTPRVKPAMQAKAAVSYASHSVAPSRFHSL